MNLVKCKGCGHDVSPRAIRCPHCSTRVLPEAVDMRVADEFLNDGSAGRSRRWMMVAVIVFLIAVCGAGAYYCFVNMTGQPVAVQYLPFQSQEGDRWGLVAADGETMLFDREFSSEDVLSVVINDRFLVKRFDERTGSTVYEFYTAEQRPRKIGREYVHAGMFFDELAPVAERGRHIEFIDREGVVRFSLEKANGKPVEKVGNFHDGMCAFVTEGRTGFIDLTGNVVISPRYIWTGNFSEGKCVVLDERYLDMEESAQRYDVIDKKGNILFSIPAEKYYMCFIAEYSDGLLAVRSSDGGCGFLDDKGNVAINPCSRYDDVTPCVRGRIGFMTGNVWGIMDRKEIVSVNPKYDNILGIIDGKHALAKRADHAFCIIDKDGLPVGNREYYNMSLYAGDEYIESDYFNVDNFLSAIGMSENGIDGLTFNALPRMVAPRTSVPTADAYIDAYHMSYTKQYQDVALEIAVSFVGPIARELTEMNYYSMGYYVYSEPTVVGYQFNETNVENFYLTIPNSGNLAGKMDNVFSKLKSKFGKEGSTTILSDNAVEIKLKGKTMRIRKFHDRVQLNWGHYAYGLDYKMED